jgi:hypothetical protein
MKSDMTASLFVILTTIAIALLMPFAQIWAINTLFGTHINYNLINWFAIVILSAFWLRIPSINRKI